MDSYVVIIKSSTVQPTSQYELATRRVFSTREEAEAYAKGIHPAHEAMVVAGRFAELRLDSVPRFPHDCMNPGVCCVFLGRVEDVDVYRYRSLNSEYGILLRYGKKAEDHVTHGAISSYVHFANYMMRSGSEYQKHAGILELLKKHNLTR